MDIEEKLLEFMRRKDYTPLRADELYKAIGGGIAFARLKKNLQRLVRDGKIAQIKRDKFCLPRDADLVTGKIYFRQSGSAKLLPDASDDGAEPHEPVHIRAEDTGVALHGDRVVVRIEKKKRRGGFRERYAQDDNFEFGSVVEVLERAFSTTTGTLHKDRYAWLVTPDDPRIGREIIVPDPSRSLLFPQPKDGEKVVVRLNEWRRRNEVITGEIEKVFGVSHTPLAEYRAILYRYNLSSEFPEAVCREVAAFPEEVDIREMKGRKDIRSIFTITIDPDDAKDFDDALSVEFLPGGKKRIGVHIADVAHYVRAGTALDAEARSRGNSTYLVGTVIPMLPHALSSGLCSLIENENRLTKSVFMTFSEKGEILGTEFANTVISSRKRLTYGQTLAFMKEDDNARVRAFPRIPAHQSGHPGRALADLNDAELDEIRAGIRALWGIAKILRERRMAHGALDLDMPEVKIYVDADGYADHIARVEHDESHQLVEEFMLAANEIVARTFFQAHFPFISRVHDAPEPGKLSELREELLAAGIKIGDLTKRSEVVKLLNILKTREDGYFLRLQFLRSMKQACYRPKADGHYGLAKTYYAHFTSPIRRYADLTVHRVFDFYLQKNRLATAPAKKVAPSTLAELAATAEHISETERTSMEAERESTKIKQLEYFEREAGKRHKTNFDAVITDIRNSGMFVELTVSQAFGMVPMSAMTDDLYYVSADETSLVGRRSRKLYKLGQIIPVQVLSVDRVRRLMDFCIAPVSPAEAKYRVPVVAGARRLPVQELAKLRRKGGKRRRR
ncbi:MAG: RNB domain-containing ribonuclease [Opitutae bacterium]|nr:RNB domain-containing ribonuclease [Opitutae bacterium]